MHQIIIRIAPNGATTVKAEGFQGPSCATVTAPFIDALGKRVTEQPTEEMFQQPTITEDIRQ